MSTLRAVASPVAAERLSQARAFLGSVPSGQEVVIVGASRAAAEDLAREVTADRGASFGWHRFGLLQLAVRLAAPALAARQRSPGTALGTEAVASRALAEASAASTLTYFGPVAGAPGFPRALSRTLGELRLARAPLGALDRVPPAGPDLARLSEGVALQLEAVGTVDQAALLDAAESALADGVFPAGLPLLLLDISLHSLSHGRFIAALARRAASLLITVPAGDGETRRALAQHCGVAVTDLPGAPQDTSLDRLRVGLFSPEVPAAREPDDTVQLFSAPGEGRECVEIARRVLAEARGGVRFDQMAIVVRAPQPYLGLLQHALARAAVPAWFEPGTSRPDPAGRAVLALLRCAEEDLSAHRFAEYLSLAQVPQPEETEAHAGEWVEPGDEVVTRPVPTAHASEDALPLFQLLSAEEAAPRAVVDGTLRAPWRWESLLVESAVIGGRDRWVARLDGLEHEYRRRREELRSEEPESPRAAALERDAAQLANLRAFALPVIEELDGWRGQSASWGEWLDRLDRLAPRVLRRPARVQRVVADLRAMTAAGPVGITEVRRVLTDRLRTLPVDPPARRFGRVFVGTPEQARGRVFRVVFVPGLAERLFPQKLREDPLLLDEARARLDLELRLHDGRTGHERLQLRLALGAATERAHLSYPRLEVGESRPRVPSFYAVEVTRAVSGRLPSLDELQREAFESARATLDWPAPPDPGLAIDAFEHDLATLRPLLDARDPAAVAGRGRYLLELNACLGRSIRERWARYHPQWSEADGIIRVAETTREALDAQRLRARPYSLSALQHYSACPYRFLLSAVYRLAPREDAAPLQRLDPLTRGSLFHRIQAECLRTLREEGRLPVPVAQLPAALDTLDDTIDRVAAGERDRLAPAIPRVWDDEIHAMGRDLHRWLETMVHDPEGWVPLWFEYAFGLGGGGDFDPAGPHDPVLVDGRFLLRGAIDLVERHTPTGALRVTDHKTGRARWPDTTIVGQGEALQPVLYSLALEQATGETVYGGRLWFCTAAGEFKVVDVPLTGTTRRIGLEVLEIIDRGIEHGKLAAYPKKGACEWCDFQAVCGRYEESRTGRKAPEKFMDLLELRSRP